MEFSNYYETILYPTQNEVLKIMKNLNLPFYLTGGTAVSRGYFHHRYSDDLDFFVNNITDFSKHVDTALIAFESAGFTVKPSTASSPSFSRFFLNQNINGLNKTGLKIDFVNDIDCHYGDIKETEIYYRTDSLQNILSNKYTALYRLSIKDVIDIIEISKHYSFNWSEIIQEANEKEAGIDLKEVVSIFKSYSDDDFLKVKWINKPDINKLKNCIEQVAKDMVLMKDNSLYVENVKSIDSKQKCKAVRKSRDYDFGR